MNAKDAIRSSANLSALVLKTYISDLDDADLMRRPGEGCNHLAWQLGHLISSEVQLLNCIAPEQGPELPDAFADVHSKETDILLEQISHLRAQLFGRKSDKVYPDSGAQPLPLFDMPEPDPETHQQATVEVPAHTRKKSGRKPLPENLVRVERIHDIDEAQKVCGCGCELSRIGEEVSTLNHSCKGKVWHDI